jgi:flagellar motility protein MotE (MotC chaperone)
LEEAGEILKVTENLLKEKEEEAEKLIEQINQLEKENERLKVFETNFVEFEENKDAFDTYIAEKTSSEDFIKWYETMNPDNAAKIYAEIIGVEVVNDELNDLVLTYAEMKPDEAAAVLTKVSETRLEMVAIIIKNLEADEAAKILGAMDSTLASRITAYLYPEQ